MLGRLTRTFRVMGLLTHNNVRLMTGPAGQQPASFKLPLKWEIPGEAHYEMEMMIYRSTTCDMIAATLKDNVKYTTAEWLGEMYKHMGAYGFELNRNFYEVIVPITKEYLKVFTRENATSLGYITISCAALKVDDQELWTLIFKKLYDDKIQRYLTLDLTAQVYSKLLFNGINPNHPLLLTLLTTIKQQKAYYAHQPQLMAIIEGAASIHARFAGLKDQPLLDEPKVNKKGETLQH